MDVELCLFIDGKGYGVAELAKGRIVLEKGKWIPPSPGRYEIRVDAQGSAVCECPDFSYRPDQRPCKHIRALRALKPIKLIDLVKPDGQIPQDPNLSVDGGVPPDRPATGE